MEAVLPRARTAVVAAMIAAVVGCGFESSPSSPKQHSAAGNAALQAPLLEGLGELRFPITTDGALAQRFFEQGLLLAWAFDFPEAERSFRESARLDPGCAMCEWGIAYVLGPTFNHPYRDRVPEASRHLQRAVEFSAGAMPRERALIRALAVRYGVDAGVLARERPPSVVATCSARRQADTDPLDLAYARAMAEVAAQFPMDVDLAVLHAEALMMLVPWAWWGRDGVAGSGVIEAIEVLERVLERAPRHSAANHYLIHALEQSRQPERALAAAARLRSLAPNASHLVHMPAHVFVRLGRYAEASEANVAAIDADRKRDTELKARGFAPLSHTSHHHHFLWASAAMEGREKLATDAARELARQASVEGQPFGSGTNDYFLALPWFAQLRFGRWQAILDSPVVSGASAYPEGVRRYARGVALARLGRPREARAELADLERIAADPAIQELTLKGIDTLAELLAIGVETLRGEIAFAQGRHAIAVARLRAAVAREDALESEEPPPWAASSRLALGSALLLAGRAQGAEAVFREDLARNPGNGWALHGLTESLQRQGRHREAAATLDAFRIAWAVADVAVPDPRY